MESVLLDGGGWKSACVDEEWWGAIADDAEVVDGCKVDWTSIGADPVAARRSPKEGSWCWSWSSSSSMFSLSLPLLEDVGESAWLRDPPLS